MPMVFDDGSTQSRLMPRHQNGANIGYADGHVKYRRPAQTVRSANDNDWRRNPTTP